MEKIMRKANDTFENVEAFTLDLGGANTFTMRQLRDDELGSVSGGSPLSMNYSKFDICAADPGACGVAQLLDGWPTKWNRS
jgi:hypothetical protein